MKIYPNPRAGGSVLVISLVIVTLSLTTLGSYLLLAANEHQAVARSQTWNSCVPVMEAGVEEALTQIYHNGITNLSANNWTLGTDGNYRKTRYVGINGSYCKVLIQPSDPPVIYSTAFVPAPLSTSEYVVREVRVTTQSNVTGKRGLNAQGTIQLNSGFFDSYNSSLGAYSPTNHGTNGIATSNANVAGAINLIGGATIYGMAATGPNGTVTLNGNAAVGDPAWIAQNGGGLESGWVINDANLQFPDESAPSTAGSFYYFTRLGTTNIAGFPGLSSTYTVSSITTSGNPLVVYGDTTIYCTQTGNYAVKISGNGCIQIMPGAKLTLYLAGNFMNTGQGIVNGNGIPDTCHVYGLPGCTSIKYSGGAAFYGVVYAPEADLAYSGTADAFGSFTANSITISGGASVHYDEALSKLGSSVNYVVASWNEIHP